MTTRRVPPFHHIGRAIKLLRTRANLKQGEMADAARITKAQASKYERGQQRPTLETLDRLLTALGIDAFDLASVLQEVEHADRVLREVESEQDEAERRRAERRRARGELVRGFAHYLERLEESLDEDDSSF